MTDEIDWNVIELTEIYESFDMVLRLLDEDFERARRVIDAAINPCIINIPLTNNTDKIPANPLIIGFLSI